MDAYVSLREYARRRAAARLTGRSHSAVHKAIATGRLRASVVRDPRGQVLGVRPEEADREWAAGTDSAQQRAAPSGGRPRQEQAFFGEPQRVAAATAESTQTGVTFQRARTMRETFLARLAELEFRERSNDVVKRADVRAEATNLGREVRDELQALADRLGPILGPISDPTEISLVLAREFARALMKLSEPR